MTVSDDGPQGELFAGPDGDLLAFVTDMYAVQLDQLAALLIDRGEPAESAEGRAESLVDDWCRAGYARSGQLTVGRPWVWALRPVVLARGLGTRPIMPHSRTLRHTHAITDVRLAIERTASYQRGGAQWVSERYIRSKFGGPSRFGPLPDGEVRWPAGADVPWAGQCWAVEVEISTKGIDTTAAKMRAILARTAERGGPPGEPAVLGTRPRYDRLAFACAQAIVSAALHAKAQLEAPMADRVDLYRLPRQAVIFNTPNDTEAGSQS